MAGALVVFSWAFDVCLDTYLPRACLFFCFVQLIWGPGTLEEREQMCCLVVTSGKICCSVTQTHKSFRNSMHINIYVFTHMLILFVLVCASETLIMRPVDSLYYPISLATRLTALQPGDSLSKETRDRKRPPHACKYVRVFACMHITVDYVLCTNNLERQRECGGMACM